MRLFLAAAIVLLVSPANACMRIGGSVQDEFDFLICLHNEVVASFNKHADSLEKLDSRTLKEARTIERLEAEIQALEQRMRALENRN